MIKKAVIALFLMASIFFVSMTVDVKAADPPYIYPMPFAANYNPYVYNPVYYSPYYVSPYYIREYYIDPYVNAPVYSYPQYYAPVYYYPMYYPLPQ